jgi:hypothetical protein
MFESPERDGEEVPDAGAQIIALRMRRVERPNWRPRSGWNGAAVRGELAAIGVLAAGVKRL